ncbi:ubiquitin carboxyl-terminal hydrolase 36-like [Patiria miniata]|uniref:Ubiquitin carboxyl-terminal hydrolase 36 n=1 Tax=Patiria miniata TaxID=46514 RepID=A0A914AKY8_PATMI|nr:ubiquitin carboxyl-terminal hydrolase 36-like [Patiria miniata]
MMTIDQTLKRDLLKTKTPGASTDPIPVEAGVQSGADLDQHLVASSKQVLHKTIDFRPAEKDISFQLQNLRVKYVALNPSQPEAVESGAASSSKHSQMNGQVEVKNDGIPAPKKILYPFEKIALSWQRCQRVGPGLINLGNTCFLNATLQCLTYTPPLTNYLLTHQHKSECREPGFCIMCELCNHVHRTFNHQQNGQAIRPMVILHRLKHFAKHMHVGRQEDAHEFLRLLIEAMQKACIHGLDKLDKYSKETSLVYQIFSGYYRSRVICSVCQNKSDTFDPFLDIGLDIKQAPTVTKALERLIRPEMLDGENLYQCKKCSRKVQAQKRFTIQRSPAVLTLCLKRFDFNRFSMGKINKDLAYSENLNLRPYMSDPKGPPIMYELYAVLKHEGASCNSGHYYCYVKAANQSWYCMNDAFVSQVSLQRVLNQNAYLLFYIRKSNFKSPMNGGESKRDVMHTNNPKPATTISKPQSLFNGPVGVPVPRPSTSTHPQQNAGFKPTVITDDKQKRPLQEQKQEQPQQEARHHLPKMIPLPVQREKLSFQFRPKGSGLGSPNSHGQQPVLVTKKQSPTTAPIKSPVVTGSGDAARQVQSEKSSTTTTTTTTVFSPLRPNPTSPPALGSPKHPLQGLVKPKSRTPQDASNMNGICKKQTGSGLVPYTAEDSNSSSDSDTNYDQVAEALSRNPAGDAGTQTPKITDKSTTKSQDEQKDVSRIENQPDTTPMRPPAAAKTLPSEGLQLSPTHLKKAGLANSINLTTIRKPDSPLKLTITTNGQAQRLKSTTHWRTADSDSQISPSPASDCSLHSNVSTNSTSEWNILEKKDAPQTPEEVKKEAAVFGWNITPSKSVNSEKSASDTDERRTTIKGPKTALKFDNIQDQTPGEKDLKKKLSHSKEETKGSTVTSHTVVESSSVPKESGDKVTDNEDLQVQGTSVDLKPQIDSELLGTSLKSENSPERGTSEECGEVATAKKKKKKKKQHLSPTDESFAELDKSELLLSESNTDKEPAEGTSLQMSSRETGNASDCLLETPKKHKKKKKKKKKKEKLEEEEEVELVEEWVERVVEPQIHDDRVPLLSDSKTHTDKHKKEHDSHDKHKSTRNLDSHSDEDEASHKHSTSYKKHKEKHSLIRRTIEKNIKLHRNRHSSSDDSRETSSRHNGHRRDSHSDSHHKRTFSHKRTHGNHESSLEHSKHYKESRKTHSSDDHSGSDYPAKIRLLEDDSPVDSHREKKKRKHSDSYRHRHSSDSKHSKSHKEHRIRDSDKDGKYSEKSPRLNGDDDSNSHRKEKKKKRKHRDEDEVEEALLHRGREDEDYKPEKKKKKKKKDRPLDEEEESTRDVEDAVTKHKHEDKVPVQQWDHHIQDGHRKHSDDGNKSKTHATWDGSHSASGVMEELGKASLKSYGPAIKSWDGGRSVLDNEVEQDSRKDRQRDPYEEDFDRGKVKKVKKHHDDSRRKMFSGRHNMFQSVQNMRNKVSKEHHGYSRFSHQSHEERPR